MTRALSILFLAGCCLIFSQQVSAQQVSTQTWVGPVDFPTGREIVAAADSQVDYSSSVYYCHDARATLYRDGEYLGTGWMSNYCVPEVTSISGQVYVPDNVPDADYICNGDFTATPYFTGEGADYYNFQSFLEEPAFFDYFHFFQFGFLGPGPPRPSIGSVILGVVYNFFQQGNPPGNCNDIRDTIRREYVTHGVNLRPACDDFTQNRASEYYSFNDLNTGDSGWALIRDPLIRLILYNDYGLDLWIIELPVTYNLPRPINSAYRNPARNGRVGGARQSRHMYGDAADIRNVSRTQQEYTDAAEAAERADADFVEPLTGPCGLGCIHADWRDHGGGYR